MKLTHLLRNKVVRVALIAPPILFGLFFFQKMKSGRKAPVKRPAQEWTRSARVIPAPSVSVVPRALGYGEARPETDWHAVAEVGGKIVEIHPEMKEGGTLKEGGEVLYRIDPSDYELALAQADANIESIEAELAQLVSQEENYKQSLAIESRSLALSEKEVARKRELRQNGTIPQSDLDAEERAYLIQEGKAQNLDNSLRLIPAQRAVLEANLAVSRAKRETAQLNVERTTIRAPFPCRVVQVNVEEQQFAQPGQTLAALYSIERCEVEAQVPSGQFGQTIRARRPAALIEQADFKQIVAELGLMAVVRFHLGDTTVEWDAEVSRISPSFDPKTRTIGVIVTVDKPYEKIVPGERPPLLKGMYCEVEMRGRPRPGTIVIPLAALHEGDVVYIATPESRLERRRVTIGARQMNHATVEAGIAEGERVIISDLVPAIEGMALETQVDDEATSALIAEATGKGPAR